MLSIGQPGPEPSDSNSVAAAGRDLETSDLRMRLSGYM